MRGGRGSTWFPGVSWPSDVGSRDCQNSSLALSFTAALRTDDMMLAVSVPRMSTYSEEDMNYKYHGHRVPGNNKKHTLPILLISTDPGE